MAGRRRRKGVPTQAEQRWVRRRAAAAARMNPAAQGADGWAAQTPGQRVSVAASHLAAVMTEVAGAVAERVADETVEYLLAEADQLSKTRRGA